MSLAARLLLLVTLALLPPLAIQAWSGLAERRAREADLRTGAVTHTRALQADLARVAEGVRQLLAALSEVPAVREGDAAGCTAYLTAVAGRFTDYVLLAANETDGTILCNSTGTPRGAYSNAERAYHRRAMATGGFAAGDLVTGVATGRRSIHFAVPFRRPDGGAGGIVLASLDEDRIARQLAAAALPPGAIAVVLDPAGTVVAAARDGRPLADGWVGRPAPDAVRAGLDNPAAGPFETPGPNGRPHLFGAVPPDPALGGIRVTVGLDSDRALADLRAATARNLLAIALGAALALLVGLLGARRFVLAPLARLTSAADRVGRHDLSARADLGRRAGALREVGDAFDRMAAALSAHEAERDRAEEARRASEERFRLTVESARDYAILLTDAEGRIETWLPGAVAVFGWTAGEIVGQPTDVLFTPEDRAAGAPAWEREAARRDGAAPDVRWHLRKDGGRVFIEGSIAALRDPGGRLRGFLKIGQDVTARRAAEERQALLSREVDHRAKNALSVVQAALRLTRAPDLPSYVRAVEGRVAALARAQTLLAEDRWSGADLETLLRGELAPFLPPDGEGPRADLSGPKVALPAGAAQPLAMAFHELATNAVKYGALSVPAGRLRIGWQVEGGPEGSLRLRWEETDGPPVGGAPPRSGFGSRVLDGTVRRQLGGTVALDWRASGLVCEVAVPLGRSAAEGGAPAG